MRTGTHQVAVIGAGIAGLSVTASLAAAGLDVVCLEATDRVGGRMLSIGVADGSLDLGATWFWAGEHRVARLLARLGIGTFPQHTAGDGLFEDGDGVRRLVGNPIDVPAFRYGGGAQASAAALAATLPPETVLRGAAVSAISGETDGLLVHFAETTVRAAHVVLAVPPALAVASIRFEPALPDRLAALAATTPVWRGAVSKVVIEYPEPFWRLAGLAGAAISARGPLREIHDMSGPDGRPAALFGFAAGAGADQRMAEQGVREQVVAQLVRLFGPEAAYPDRVSVRDWSREPYTSPPDVLSLDNYGLFGNRIFGEPALRGRLHWASTETSTVNPGHVEGALAAAEHIAANLIAVVSAGSVQQ
jgi:monoamine oxidase